MESYKGLVVVRWAMDGELIHEWDNQHFVRPGYRSTENDGVTGHFPKEVGKYWNYLVIILL